MFCMSEDEIRSHLGLGAREVYVISALPNTTAAIRQWATITASLDPDTWPVDVRELASWFLGSFGEVLAVGRAQFDATAVLSGTIPALISEYVAGLLAGSPALGLEDEVALPIMLRGLRGTVGLMEEGESADDIVAKVTTKEGITEAGFKVLREGNIRQLAENAVRENVQKLEKSKSV
jgi:pyrroline-5-carboxylate reductase